MSLATAAAGAILRPWVLPAAGIALAGLLSALAVQSYRVNSLQSDLSGEQAKAANIRAAGFEAGQKQALADLADLATVNTAIGKALDNERLKSAAAADAAAAAAGAADSLRRYAGGLAARCAAATKGAADAGGGPAPAAPGLVLAGLLDRVEAEGREAAALAERSLTAAEACNAYSEALDPLR